MSAETYIAKKAASSLANRFRPRLINWFLRKAVPSNSENIVLEISEVPSIRLDYEHHFYNLSMEVTLRNFDYYQLELNSFECGIVIGRSRLMTLKETTSFVLKPGQKEVHRVEKTLTDGEIQRAKSLFGNRNIELAQFDFRCAGKNRFGVCQLNPSKNLCVQLIEFQKALERPGE